MKVRLVIDVEVFDQKALDDYCDKHWDRHGREDEPRDCPNEVKVWECLIFDGSHAPVDYGCEITDFTREALP